MSIKVLKKGADFSFQIKNVSWGCKLVTLDHLGARQGEVAACSGELHNFILFQGVAWGIGGLP